MEYNFEKQHTKGKLHALERAMLLCDAETFRDLTLVAGDGSPLPDAEYDGVLVGEGLVHGKPVCLAAQDFTFMGGTLGEKHGRQIVETQKRALQKRCPMIFINDSGGARIQEGVAALNCYGEIFYQNTLASGVIPQISVIAGPTAGGAVYSPGLTDFVFVMKGLSKMFVTGPQVVKIVTHEDTTAEELGGAEMHAAESGVAHFLHETEEDCFAAVRRLISFLPENNTGISLDKTQNNSLTSVASPPANAEAVLAEIASTEKKRPYDMERVVKAVFDGGDFLPVQNEFAPSVLVGFARLGGATVGMVANQPMHTAGVLDIHSSNKAARFVRFCDAFGIPIITFTDVTGYLPGKSQEAGGIIRHGAKLLYAFCEATVPKIGVILRNAYGGAYIAMNSKATGADKVFTWPTAEIGVMGSRGAVEILFAKQTKALPGAEREAFLTQKAEEYERAKPNLSLAIEQSYVDAVIRPEDTRQTLRAALRELKDKPGLQNTPSKKHGNMPL